MPGRERYAQASGMYSFSQRLGSTNSSSCLQECFSGGASSTRQTAHRLPGQGAPPPSSPRHPSQASHATRQGQGRIAPGRCPLASAGIDAGGPGRGLPLCTPLPDCFACPPSPRHLPRPATPHGRGDRDGRNANHHHRAWFWGMSRDISSDSARNLSLRQPRNFHIDNQSIFTRMF